MSDTNSLMSTKLETGIPLQQPTAETTVFDLMRSFQEQLPASHSANRQLPPQLLFPQTTCDGSKFDNEQSSDGQVTDELRHRFLAAAIAMMNSNSSVAAAQFNWRPGEQSSLKTADDFSSTGWEDLNLASRLFTGLMTSQAEASPPMVTDFQFMASSPFNNLPLDNFNFSRLSKSTIGNSNFLIGGQSRGSDEDFCGLCQKHFCNKYYLRKHKNDVHRIPSEPFSQPRRRDINDMVKSEMSDTESNKSLEWTNILSNNIPSVENNLPSRKNSLEQIQSSLASSEVIANLNTSNEEEQQNQQVWLKRSPEMGTPLIHFNAKTSFGGGSTRVELGENATFIPPVISSPQNNLHAEVISITSANSRSSNSTSLNAGALDMFKSSMAAAKLADRVVCDLCKKELCNKYFLRTHKTKVHGLSPTEVGGPAPRSSFSKVSAAVIGSDETVKANAFTPTSYPININSTLLPPPPLPISMHPTFGFPQILPQLPAPLGGLSMPMPWLPLMNPSITSEDTGLMFGSTKLSTISPPSDEAKSPFARLKEEEEEFQWDKENTSFNKADDPMNAAAQLMAANTLVTCPLCEKTIGPRLFLPTHLTSAHGLSPTDPTFFIFILSARSVEGKLESKEWNINLTATTKVTPLPPTMTVATNESMNTFTPSSPATSFANPNLIILRSTAPPTNFTTTPEWSVSVPDSHHESMPTFLSFMNNKSMHHISSIGSSGDGNLFDSVVPAFTCAIPPPPPPMSDSFLMPPVSGTMATGQQFISPLGMLPDPQTNPLPPPPLGFISLPPPPSQASDFSTFRGGLVSTNKWNPVHLAAAGLTSSSPSNTSNSSTSKLLGGSSVRKSPNQMRVLCDICNKWICNKYFLRTHKTNKHGISEPPSSSTLESSSTVTVSSSMRQGFMGGVSPMAVNPMDMDSFHMDGLRLLTERDGEKNVPEGSCEEFLALVSAAAAAAKDNYSSTVAPWSATAVSGRDNDFNGGTMNWLFPSALRGGLPEVTIGDGILPHFAIGQSSIGENLSMKPQIIDRGFPLNLSLKQTNYNHLEDPISTRPSTANNFPFKYGVCQMLINSTNPSSPSVLPLAPKPMIIKRRRRRRRQVGCNSKRQRVTVHRLLLLARRQVHSQMTVFKAHMAVSGDQLQRCTTGQHIHTASPCKRFSSSGEGSKPWQNLCQTCNAWFNKRSQLEAHLYATGHRRYSRPKSEENDKKNGVYSLIPDVLSSKFPVARHSKLPAPKTNRPVHKECDNEPRWSQQNTAVFSNNKITASSTAAYQMQRINEACAHMIRPITTFTETTPTI